MLAVLSHRPPVCDLTRVIGATLNPMSNKAWNTIPAQVASFLLAVQKFQERGTDVQSSSHSSNEINFRVFEKEIMVLVLNVCGI